MRNHYLKFEIKTYDINREKKTIVRKLTKDKYMSDKPKVTDYAVLNGLATFVTKNDQIYGSYWLAKTVDIYDGPMDMIAYGPDYTIQSTSNYSAFPNDKSVGIKPSIKYSLIENMSKILEQYIYPKYLDDEEYLIIEFGEYPQNIVSTELNSLLNSLYENNQLKQTGNVYSYDIGNPKDGMKCIEEEEYEFNGEKYVRVLNLNPEGILSNGQKAGNQEYYWVKIEPVVWFVDKNEDYATTDKIIIGGVAYNSYETSAYEKTYACRFIDEYFRPELMQNSKEKEPIDNQKTVHKVKVKRIK